jgi:hypothetical protein
MDGWDWGLSQCWRHLHWMYDAWIPRQIHALYESAAGLFAIVPCGCDIWRSDSCIAAIYTELVEQRTKLATQTNEIAS